MTDTATKRREERPDPDPAFLRGRCEKCGLPVISECVYVGAKGYRIMWRCWGAKAVPATCDYERTL